MSFPFAEALQRSYDAGMGCTQDGDDTGVVYFLGKGHKEQLVVRSVSPRSRGKGEWKDLGAPCLFSSLVATYHLVPLPWASKPIDGQARTISDLLDET